MKKIRVTTKATRKLREKYPLIREEDLEKKSDNKLIKEWVQFVDSRNQYLGTGYIGKQNKGIGWVLSFNPEETMTTSFFEKLFSKAITLRQHFLNNENTTAFRLINGEGDGIGGLTVDLYGNHAVFSWYNESIYGLRNEIIAAFRKVSPFVNGAYEKIRFGQNNLPESQFLFGESIDGPLLVKENGVTYATYMNDGMMTGIFLDQKNVRGRLVDGLATGKSVLNMFSYTGAFSVAAAMGGATKTTSVDLAKRSLPKTQEMFEVNGLKPEDHQIVVMDVFDFIKYGKRKGLSYDMVILDPPSFARNKKRTFSVAQNYGDLVEETLPLLNKGGVLIASTNAANVTMPKYRKMVEEALSKSERKFRLIETHRLPADFQVLEAFQEGNYLKVLIYQIESELGN